MAYELTGLGKAKAGQIDSVHNAEEAVLAVLADRNIAMDADELAEALHSSEEKMELILRRFENRGYVKELGEGVPSRRRFYGPAKPVNTGYEHKTGTGERTLGGLGGAIAKMMKGTGRALDGIFSGRVDKRGAKFLTNHNDDAWIRQEDQANKRLFRRRNGYD
jgi:hypothetical protein